MGFRGSLGDEGSLEFAADKLACSADAGAAFSWLPKILFIPVTNARRAPLNLFRTRLSREGRTGLLSSAALYLSIQSCSASVNGVRFTSMGRPDLTFKCDLRVIHSRWMLAKPRMH